MDKEEKDFTEYIMPLSNEQVDELLYDVPESERTPAMIDEVNNRKAVKIKLKKNPVFDEPMRNHLEEHEQRLFFGDTGIKAPTLESYKMLFIDLK
jgi:hypothetical protein